MGDSSNNTDPISGDFNPQSLGQSPSGTVPIPIAGIADITYNRPLTVNTGTPANPSDGSYFDTGILYYNGATAIDYQMYADTTMTFTVTYHAENGDQLPFMPNPVNYDPTIIQSFQSSLNAKGYGVRFRIVNSSQVAQTVFMFSIGFSQGVQPTMQSAVTSVNDTNMAVVTKGTHQAKENGTGTRKETTGTTVGSKFGIDVNVVNPNTTQNITGSVEVSNDSGNPLPVSGTVIIANPVTSVEIANNTGNAIPVSGSITVLNPVTSIEVANDTGNPLPVSGTVEITNDVGNAIPVTINNFPTSTEISNDAGNPIPISGSVTITNPVTAIEVSNDIGSPLPVSGSVTVLNPVTSIEVSNDVGSPLPISGSVTVTNFPASQSVSGSVAITNPVTSVAVSNLPATQAVSGTITIANPVSSVAVSNFPASQAVTGTFYPATQPVSGTVAISNFPASTEIANDSGNPIPVNGTVTISNPVNSVSVSNFPASQAVTGTFYQATQPISATALPLPTGASTEATLQLLLTALNAINTDQGAPADAQATTSTGTWGEIALLKGILNRPANGVSTAVTVAATQATVLAANPLRKGAAIYSTVTVYISLGATCSATIFTTRLSANTYYEVPFGYTGIITSFGTATTLNVTELT